MPIYEYECAECGINFDKLQRFGDPAPDTCPNGHRAVHRLMSQPTIIFKGSGFYVTDNGRDGRNGRSKSAKATKANEAKSTAETKTSSGDKKKE
jgi:putative FmdB family regulatory protein